ncbi:hypothetical protein LTR56_025706 [Elasticomyces elasticus]|nr:hypothetical protein LTR56_025706 [Elasticomyces elasticus]KAK3642364.1 hypothetical protein LTR22_016179 [Elasticomyces elasticus]KAK4914440.1 hypothetical protein LTR49_017360 [Elasticomyces elasticus]KAK5760415.1 hypothetical protein LTS12_009459 [Elasticomyces elasticus]
MPTGVHSFLTRRTWHQLHQLHGNTACAGRHLQRCPRPRHFVTKPNDPLPSPKAPETASPADITPLRRAIAASSPYFSHALAPFRAYGRVQRRRPWLTQLFTTATIFFLGDLSAQAVASQRFKSKEYEPLRGLRALAIGAGLAIPGYTWFMFLGRNFNYSTWIRTMGTKILIQQCVFIPLVNVYFFSMQILLAGGTLEEAKRRVIDTVPISWTNSWKVWPAVMAFTFTYVPMHYRSIFNGFVGVCWQTYLSWINQKAEAAEQKKGAVQDVELLETSMVPQKA